MHGFCTFAHRNARFEHEHAPVTHVSFQFVSSFVTSKHLIHLMFGSRSAKSSSCDCYPFCLVTLDMMRWLITLVVPIAAVPQLNASTQNVSIICNMNVSLQAEGYLHDWCKDVSFKTRFPACYPVGVAEWHPENNKVECANSAQE